MNIITKVGIGIILILILALSPELFVLVVIVGGIYWLYKEREDRCPFCKADKSNVELLKRKIISEQPRYTTVTRHDIIKMPKKNAETEIEEEINGTIERQEQVRVIDTIRRYYYKCKVCKKNWTKDVRYTEEG